MTLNAADYDIAVMPRDMPVTLLVVVDTEEEFDWAGPFSRDSRSTLNLREQWRAQAVFDKHGLVPTYVIDQPVAEDAVAVRWLRETRDRGACEVGAHLHPWLSPPLVEAVNRVNSYGCNLPEDLQAAKIESLTRAIGDAFEEAPTAFRMGRYGLGASTFKILPDLGYTTDLSLAPHSSFKDQGGPSFYGWHNAPFWAGHEKRLLSFPVTTGFSGAGRRMGRALVPLLDRPFARALHVPGFLARSCLLERARVTPEGQSVEELKRLLAALVADGERVITLSYHSSTLLSGATVYARDDAERDAFIGRLDAVLTYFSQTLGGKFASLSTTRAQFTV